MAVVGIDLGTTNTVVSVVRDGQAMTVRDPDGEYLIPSVVSFHPTAGVLVGRPAKERRVIDAANTVYSIKRLIGRSWNSEEVRRARTRFPFEMREGPGQAALVVARNETFTLPEISAFVLRHARAVAEKALGEQVERAVVTVPANFNDLQRAATKVAGRVAGLEVLRILNEPTAAALAYGYGKSKGERIAIYDFGGGTFDVTLLDLSGNVFEVLATAGNTFLGGDDIDLALAEEMARACLEQHRIDASADTQVFERLRYYAERLKMDLSAGSEAQVDVPDIGVGPGGKPVRLSFPMSRARLDALAGPIVERTFDVCQEAMSIARLTPSDFDQVVLVGGSTRLPLVRSRVEAFFGRKPLDRVNPDEVVAIGAAIQANALSGGDRRRSVIPRAPMPASLARKSQPPPHPKSRTTTNPMVVGPGGLPPVSSGKSEPPAGRRRVTTGVGLGLARDDSAPRGPTAARAGSQAKTSPPARRGTLGLGTPAARSGERPSEVDALWGAGSGDSKPPIQAGPIPAGVPVSLDPEAEVPTRASWDLPGPGGPPGGGPLPVPEAPGSADPFAASPMSPDSDEELTRVGLKDAPMAGSGGELDGPFAGAGDPKPSPALTGRAARAAAASQIDAGDLGFDDPLPPPPPAAPAAPPPPSKLARTQLGVAPPPQRSRMDSAAVLDAEPPAAPAPAPPAPRGALPPGTLLGAPPLHRAPPLDFSAIQGAEASQNRAVARAAQISATLEAPGAFAPAQPEPRRLAMEEPAASRPPLPLLVDVTPLSLSVETAGGYRDVIIPRNSPVPCEQARTFVTARDGQTTVLVRVGQGEAARFAGDTLLGGVELSGLRAAARGVVQIVVTFALDTDGILEVRAADAETGKSAKAQLRLVGLPDNAEVDQMQARQADRVR